jgi:hypothetical protein
MSRSLISITVVALTLYGMGCTAGVSGRHRDTGTDPGDGGPMAFHDTGPIVRCDSATDPTCDSDMDGVTDLDELAHGTDPNNSDTDGDGVSDFAESLTGGDPLASDDHGGLAPGDFFVVLPYEGDHALRDLEFGTNIGVADVYFLIDTTGSMGGPLANVQSSLSRISAELTTVIPDLQMGVGHHDDFPFGDDLFNSYGTPGPVSTIGDGIPGPNHDVPYENMQSITANLSDVQAGLNALTLGSGNDGPESQTEGLYQVATGEGATWTGSTTFTLNRRDCFAVPDEIGPRRGYPCFRPGSLPIIVLVSDVTWHNGSGLDAGGFCGDPACTYAGISPAPHTFDQAANALNDIGARFIGVAVNGGSRPDQEAMARATGSVDGSGTPLVFDSSGGEVSDAIITGIQSLVGGTPQDVSTTTENVTGNPHDQDARLFIKAIVPVEGYRGTVRGPMPGVTYTSHDEAVFYGVVPGTFVTFNVDFWNDVVPPPSIVEVYQARIIVLGNGVARLDTRRVFILVPPDGHTILI